MKSILLVEDDEMSRFAVESILRDQMHVISCKNLKEAKQEIERSTFDLILLDVMLPDGDGFQFLATIKNLKQFSNTPVLFISGRSSVDDQVLGYSLGADEYLVKPIEPKLLLAKIKAKLKSDEKQRNDRSIISIGNLKIDTLRQVATIETNHSTIDPNLTPIEMKLLTYFASVEEHVISREKLLDNVWGNAVHISDRTIDTHVSHLRKKMPEWTHTIDSVRGMGYRLIVKSALAAA